MEVDDDLFELDEIESANKYEGWQGAIADYFNWCYVEVSKALAPRNVSSK